MPTHQTAPPFSRTATIGHGLALLVLLITAVWGAAVYPGLPDQIPTHWNARGEADAFSQKSVLTAFGPMFVAIGMVAILLVVHLLLNRSRHLVPAERRSNDLTFGYINLSMAAIFAWVSISGWHGLALSPLFIVFTLLAAVPVLAIVGLHLPAIIKERKALTSPEDPSLNPKFWVWGGFFYNNPNDARAFVPKPPHTGTGLTMNLATAWGKLVVALIVLVFVGTLVLMFVL